jgi:hypothetical protein
MWHVLYIAGCRYCTLISAATLAGIIHGMKKQHTPVTAKAMKACTKEPCLPFCSPYSLCNVVVVGINRCARVIKQGSPNG